jgi:hypothetical protein
MYFDHDSADVWDACYLLQPLSISLEGAIHTLCLRLHPISVWVRPNVAAMPSLTNIQTRNAQWNNEEKAQNLPNP